MKTRWIENARVEGTFAQIFIIFKIYYYSMKTKQQKAFSRGKPMAKFLKILGLWFLFAIFFANIVNIER